MLSPRLSQLLDQRTSQAKDWTTGQREVTTCGHFPTDEGFLCVYDKEPVLRCRFCGWEHMLEHTPRRCDGCKTGTPDPLTRPAQEFKNNGDGMTITVPLAVLCKGCVVELPRQRYDMVDTSVGGRTQEAVDRVQRWMETGTFAVEACKHVVALVSTTPPNDRHPESIRVCADHPSNGLYCPECWRHHGSEHHSQFIPDCAQCGAPEGGVWIFGAMAPVQPVRLRSMTGGNQVTLTGRIRVEPTAQVCTDCQESLLQA